MLSVGCQDILIWMLTVNSLNSGLYLKECLIKLVLPSSSAVTVGHLYTAVIKGQVQEHLMISISLLIIGIMAKLIHE